MLFQHNLRAVRLKSIPTLFFLLLSLVACQPEREVKPTPTKTPDSHQTLAVCPEEPLPTTITIEKPCHCQCPPSKAINKRQKPKAETLDLHQNTSFNLLKRSHWQSVQWLQQQNLLEAWPAWLQSCQVLQKDLRWRPVCQLAQSLDKQAEGTLTNQRVQQFFTQHFNLFQAHNDNGSNTGIVTGYYQPVLKGSRTRSARYNFPLYHTPNDLMTISLANQYPSLQHKRVRGRLVGDEIIPYFSRGEIDTVPSPLKHAAFLYLNDPIDVFFLHIQGSGVIALESGEVIQVGYDNHNGHPYHSIGKVLIRRGELTRAQASMAGIKQWARANPDRLQALLNENPSYVFFKELPQGLPGPLGALGVPLLPKQAIAVDKRYIPLGAPVFLSTTYPNSSRPLNKLMMAQDTGGAIKGGVRADFYWGAGNQAGAAAGAMKQSGKMWVLLPKTFSVQ